MIINQSKKENIEKTITRSKMKMIMMLLSVHIFIQVTVGAFNVNKINTHVIDVGRYYYHQTRLGNKIERSRDTRREYELRGNREFYYLPNKRSPCQHTS